MLYGLSRNLCQNSAKIQFLCHSMLFGNLGMHASAPRNCCCCLFSSARPLSCSLLFSQQEFFSSSLVLSTRLLFLPLALGISPKSLLASHQDFFLFLLTQEWVLSQQDCFHFLPKNGCPLALINLMREGEEFSNLTAKIRLDGWLRFGVFSLTLTLIIKLSFNLHLTN
jgi:hypothetical protein